MLWETAAGRAARFVAAGTGILTRSSVAIGVLGALLALLSQFTLVHFCFEGNWTGLFFTGDYFPVPRELAGENLYVFENSDGYDGQFYHYVAHDPFRRRGLSDSMDGPELRYQRILVPLMSYLLAGGSDELVDLAYYAVILFFVFLGCYWLSRFAREHNRHPAFGLAFLLIPSVVVSIERMTVEIALAALTAGFALYATRGPAWKLYLVMAAAVLTRETGLMLIGGYSLYCLLRKELLRAAVFSTSALPGLLWIYSLSRRGHALAVQVMRGGSRSVRVAGLVRRLWKPVSYPFAGTKLLLVRITDEISWIGMILISLAGIRMAMRRQPGPIEMTAALSGAVALLAGSATFWYHPVGYSRPFSCLLVLVGLRVITDRAWWVALPILMIDLRIAVEAGPRLLTVVRNMFS